MASEVSVPSLFQMGYYWEAKIFLTSVKLDIYTPLAEHPKSATQLAAEIGADSDALTRLLHALVTIGLLKREGDHYKNIPELAEFLVKTSRFYMGELMLLQDAEWDHWGKLEEIVRTGKPTVKDNIFINHPERGATVSRVLHRMAQRVAPALAEKIDLSVYKTLLDVGGGGGAFSIAFAKRYLHLKTTLFDLPQTLKISRENIEKEGLSDRVDLVEGNFNAGQLPGPFDVVFASDILHYQTEAENMALVQRLYDATATGGVLILKDMFIGDDNKQPGWNAVFSIHMMVYSEKGRCFKGQQIREWMKKAGFGNIVEMEKNTILAGTKGI
ncbi:MAG: methyltransferase [Nitrospirota bacterium]|nr:methyltransferase [Nitrospirota bacterium]